jgi:class 3 adenylate cyclase/tetratricopeptide (TPR) repeat protein/energy-coupling factor transporter ATP-binding protein EcfA2
VADDIGSWLQAAGLGQYVDAFVENAVDLDLLPHLTNEDLKDLGIAKVGDRRKLLLAIERLRPTPDTGPEFDPVGAEGGAAVPQRAAEAERRQLTVLFCDLVGSTELSRRLDPEDLRDVMGRYQDVVAGAVTRFGGHVAKYLGDGVLAYFGWPQAHEDQAERAVHAGLAAVRGVGDLAVGAHAALSARAGIATGQVVVGDLVGESGRDVEAVIGETPNLAARLQQLAEPGHVVVGEATRQLIGRTFEAADLGGHDLKGFDAAVRAWRITGETAVDSRFEAAHDAALTRMIGREEEMSRLLESWQSAIDDRGRMLLLSGEAGIGKSRLVEALCGAVQEQRHFRLRFQCSPLHANSAFHPIIQRLERAAGLVLGDDNDDKLDKLEALLRSSVGEVDATTPLFAALLSIPAEARYGALDLAPQKRRELTIEALVSQTLSLARIRPILFILEDTHWIDPSTAAFLEALVPRIAGAAVFILVTCRPEFDFPWAGHRHQSSLTLDRLNREQCSQIVAAVAGPDLSEDVIGRIVDRADGVPLYLEELTRTVIATDGGSAGGDGEIPNTLHASLTARLDRLGEAKDLARIGAVIGRSFPLGLIAKVAKLPLDTATRILDALVASGVVIRHGAAAEATYTFRHALIQDVAYDSLLRSRRRDVHARLADVLLQDFPDWVETGPETVAHHFSLAALPDRAVEYWLRAGQRAGERSAHVEAVAHLEAGLAQLEQLPPAASKDEMEFSLRIALGASLLTAEGWSAPKVAENYERAQELSVSGDDVRKLFIALRGLANVFFLNGKVKDTRRLVDRLEVMALEQDDTGMCLEAFRAAGMCALFMGDFGAALENLQRANAMYERVRHHALAFVYGTDPAVVGLSGAAWANWFLGDPEEAGNSCDAALELAIDLDHPFSLTYAQSLAASLHQFRRQPEAVLVHAEAAIANATEHDYPYWRGWAGIMRGWALGVLGNPSEGIDVLRRGFEIYEGTGAKQIGPYVQTMLAELYGLAGLPEKGIDALNEAFGPGNTTDVCFFEAEALRIHGELLRQSDSGDGLDYFTRAMDLARGQGARALELRAALSAAAAARQNGDAAAARTFVEDIHRRFDSALIVQETANTTELLAALGMRQE